MMLLCGLSAQSGAGRRRGRRFWRESGLLPRKRGSRVPRVSHLGSTSSTAASCCPIRVSPRLAHKEPPWRRHPLQAPSASKSMASPSPGMLLLVGSCRDVLPDVIESRVGEHTTRCERSQHETDRASRRQSRGLRLTGEGGLPRPRQRTLGGTQRAGRVVNDKRQPTKADAHAAQRCSSALELDDVVRLRDRRGLSAARTSLRRTSHAEAENRSFTEGAKRKANAARRTDVRAKASVETTTVGWWSWSRLSWWRWWGVLTAATSPISAVARAMLNHPRRPPAARLGQCGVLEAATQQGSGR